LSVIFLLSMVIGFSGLVAQVTLWFALRRMRIPMHMFMTRMPPYLLRVSRDLPSSPKKARLILLGNWSVIAFLIAMVGAGISGPMLGSLHESGMSNNRMRQDHIEVP
jgi:hypothetical protein